jgi:hypothetical protein
MARLRAIILYWRKSAEALNVYLRHPRKSVSENPLERISE